MGETFREPEGIIPTREQVAALREERKVQALEQIALELKNLQGAITYIRRVVAYIK